MNPDSYAAWLDLPAGPRPPDPYTLLGVRRFERDPGRIATAAAERARLASLRATADRRDELRSLLEQIASAEHALVDPARRRRVEVALRFAEKAGPGGGSREAGRMQSVTKTRVPEPPVRSTLRPAWLLGAAIATAAAALVAVVSWPVGEASPEGVVSDERPVLNPQGEPRKAEVVKRAGAAARPAPRVPVEARRPAVEAAVIAAAPPLPAPDVWQVPAAEVVPVEAAEPILFSVAEYRPPLFEDEDRRQAYADAVRGLLDEAFGRRGTAAGLDARLREVDSLAPGAPFTDFAAALALAKRLKFAEAEARMRAAGKGEVEPFLPARRSLVRLLLNGDRRDDALAEAVAFAGLLGAEPAVAAWHERRASVRWLGRATAALESPWLPGAAPAAEVGEADAAIRGLFGEREEAAYESGRRSLREEVTARGAAVEAEVAALTAAHETRRSEALGAIAEDRGTARDERGKVSRSAAEWKEWLAGETKGLDARLKTLENAHAELTIRAEAATAAYLALAEQVRNQQFLEQKIEGGVPAIVNPQATAQLVVAMNQALAEARLLNGRIAAVRSEAGALLAKRQAAVSRFERETRTLAAKNESLRKWEGILKRRADEAGAEEAADVPAVKALRRRLRDFDTYMPFDLEAERGRVLEALGAAG